MSKYSTTKTNYSGNITTNNYNNTSSCLSNQSMYYPSPLQRSTPAGRLTKNYTNSTTGGMFNRPGGGIIRGVD